MSHLPLDARAILQHLNELGYRNISAEQLREFLKGKTTLTQTKKKPSKDSSSRHCILYTHIRMCVHVYVCLRVLSACNKHFKGILDFSTILFLFLLKFNERFVTLPHCTRKSKRWQFVAVWKEKKRNKNEYYSRIVNNSAWGWETHTCAYLCARVCVCVRVCAHMCICMYAYIVVCLVKSVCGHVLGFSAWVQKQCKS